MDINSFPDSSNCCVCKEQITNAQYCQTCQKIEYICKNCREDITNKMKTVKGTSIRFKNRYLWAPLILKDERRNDINFYKWCYYCLDKDNSDRFPTGLYFKTMPLHLAKKKGCKLNEYVIQENVKPTNESEELKSLRKEHKQVCYELEFSKKK